MLVRVKTVVRAKHGQADGVRRGTRPGTTRVASAVYEDHPKEEGSMSSDSLD